MARRVVRGTKSGATVHVARSTQCWLLQDEDVADVDVAAVTGATWAGAVMG